MPVPAVCQHGGCAQLARQWGVEVFRHRQPWQVGHAARSLTTTISAIRMREFEDSGDAEGRGVWSTLAGRAIGLNGCVGAYWSRGGRFLEDGQRRIGRDAQEIAASNSRRAVSGVRPVGRPARLHAEDVGRGAGAVRDTHGSYRLPFSTSDIARCARRPSGL